MANQGLWLEGLVANGATSLPGHASILTGLGAQEHGAITNTHSLKVGAKTLAQDFARRGYRTAGVCRNQLISREAGFDRGFESYWSTDHPLTGQAPPELIALRIPLSQLGLKGSKADLTSRYGRAYLRRDGAPFFLFLQYLTCHTPYDDRHGWATGERVAAIRARYESGEWTNTTDYPLEEVAAFHARYLGSVYTADRILGELRETLRERGLAEDTVILVTSDHGENLAEHGHRRIGHHSGPFETSLRVPLVASVAPGDLPAAYRELTGQDRIAALALALATPETSPSSERDLDMILRKDRHFAFVESHAVLYDDSLKTVVDLQRPELGAQVFRWREDGRDRAPESVGPSDPRAQEIEQILRENQIREALNVEVELTPERERALRALGYIE
jgi:arylsulfatase A-like enzyme